MARKAEAYVDTSALIAFLDRSDSHHVLFRRLFSDPPPLLTTSLVVAEGHGWFLRRYDRLRGLQFMALIEELQPMRVTTTGPLDVAGGTRMLQSFRDQDLTLTDAVGLHVMREQRVSSCWSTDRHLRLTGVPLVIDQN